MAVETMFDRFKRKAKYAQMSIDRNLLYEVKGMAEIAYELGAITAEEAREINHETVYFMNTNRDFMQAENALYLEACKMVSASN